MDFMRNNNMTIYQQFKMQCEMYSGHTFYNEVKKTWNVKHLKDLENVYRSEYIAQKLQEACGLLQLKMSGKNIQIKPYMFNLFSDYDKYSPNESDSQTTY